MESLMREHFMFYWSFYPEIMIYETFMLNSLNYL